MERASFMAGILPLSKSDHSFYFNIGMTRTISSDKIWYIMHYRKGDELDVGTETNINLNHQLYYHFLGTDQSEDILCWKDPENPKYTFGAHVTDDGKVSYIVLDAYIFYEELLL